VNTGTFGEIDMMDTARDVQDDTSSSARQFEAQMEDVSFNPANAHRNGNLQEDMSVEPQSDMDRIFRIVETQNVKVDELICANETLFERAHSLELAKAKMQELYTRKDCWVLDLYRKDALEVVNRCSRDLNGVSDNALNLHALSTHLVQLELPERDAGGQNLSLEGIKADLILMKDRLGSDSIGFGETTLGSYGDTLLFVTSSMDSEVMSYSFFYDLVTLMDAATDPQTDVSVHLKNEYETQHSNYSSVMEASTTASFFRIAPLVLSGITSTDSKRQIASRPMIAHQPIYEQ